MDKVKKLYTTENRGYVVKIPSKGEIFDAIVVPPKVYSLSSDFGFLDFKKQIKIKRQEYKCN